MKGVRQWYTAFCTSPVPCHWVSWDCKASQETVAGMRMGGWDTVFPLLTLQ